METFYSDLLRFGYHLGLAVVVGGGIAVGLLSAPAIFASAPSRSEAARVFAAVLARFDAIAVPAVLLVGLTSVLRAGAFGEEASDPRILVRWIALALAAAATLYGSVYANPVARQIRSQTPGFDDLPPQDLRRREFAALHQRSRSVMTVAVVAGLVALYLS